MFFALSATRVAVPALGLALALSLVVACSAETSQPAAGGETPDAGKTVVETGGDGDGDGDSESDAGKPAAGRTKKDAAAPSAATFEISNASFENRKGVGGKYYYTITFTLENTAAGDVTSLDTLTYDFGGGLEISLSKPACNGKLVLAAGDTTSIETQIGVDPDTGALEDYSNFCSPTQYFGGATGKAPTSETFAGPIAVTVGGKTSKGTFTGTGSATRE